MRAGIISIFVKGELTQEKTVCDAWAKFEETGDESYIDSIQDVPSVTIRR